MDIPGVSLNNDQAVRGKSGKGPAQNENTAAAGWKYITVKDGDTIYTYIVIGKNMKMLIGQTSVHDKDKNKDKANKDATGGKDGAGASATPNMAEQAATDATKEEKIAFGADTRMLGLTGCYQKKMREIMRNMENLVAYNSAPVSLKAKIKSEDVRI